MTEFTTWELYPVETNIQITYTSKKATKFHRCELVSASKYMDLTVHKPIQNRKNSWFVSIATDVENIDKAVMIIHDSEANSRLKKSGRVPGTLTVNPYSIMSSSIKDSGDGKVSFEFKAEII